MGKIWLSTCVEKDPLSSKLNYQSYKGLSMNDVQLHSHAPTHASIYLGMLLSHMQNFI